MGRPPWWEITYTLDDWPARNSLRAASGEQAAWDTALDLADRGFGDRVKFTAVKPRAEHGQGSEKKRS